MNKLNFKKTILVDLDGVLNQYKGNFDKELIPPIADGAKEFLKELNKDYEVKLFLDYSGCRKIAVFRHLTGWARKARTAPYRKSALQHATEYWLRSGS